MEPTYRDYLSKLLPTWPELELLDDFISDRDWDKWAAHGAPKPQGLQKFDVICVDFTHSTTDLDESPTIALDANDIDFIHRDEASLEAHIRKKTVRPHTRLYLVEDLSAKVVEYFGKKSNVDPHFFEEHLRRHEYLKSGSARAGYRFGESFHSAEPSVLDRVNSPHFCMDFRRPYAYTGTADENSMKLYKRARWYNSNIQRGAYPLRYPDDNRIIYSQERFSGLFFNDGGIKTGIFLFDVNIPIDAPKSMKGYRNFLPAPGYRDNWAGLNDLRKGRKVALEGTHLPLRSDYIRSLLLSPQETLQSLAMSATADVPSEFGWFSHIYRVACAESEQFIRDTSDRLFMLQLTPTRRWREIFRVDIPPVDGETAVITAQELRVAIAEHRVAVERTESLLRRRFFRKNMEASFKDYETSPLAILEELQYIQQRLRNLERMTEVNIEYFTAMLSVKDYQQAQVQAENFTRLNYIVIILAPIGVVAAVLAVENWKNYISTFAVTVCIAVFIAVASQSRFVLDGIGRGRAAIPPMFGQSQKKQDDLFHYLRD